MSKFEIYDKVKIVTMDTRWYDYSDKMSNTLGQIGVIIGRDLRPDGYAYLVDIKGMTTYYYPESWLELVEKKKPEWYNGKVICITAEPGSKPIFNFTAGKVYEIVNGTLYNDQPCCCKRFADNIKSFQHLQKIAGAFHSGSVEFIEFKGFASETQED